MENNYQLSRIHNYVLGLMSREDMHALEQEALEDPFLQDAIDGYRLQKGVDTAPLSLLQKRLNARVAQRSLDKNKRFYSWQRLAVGLVAAVMFVVVCSLLVFRYLQHRPSNAPDQSETMMLSLRVQLVPDENGNAEPADGWDNLSKRFDAELKPFSGTHSFDIRFDVANGKAKNIRISGSDSRAVVDILRSNMMKESGWKGTKGAFRVHVGEAG